MTCTETPRRAPQSRWRRLARWVPYAALAVYLAAHLVTALSQRQYLYAALTPLLALVVLPILPRLTSRPLGDLVALQRKQEIDERREAIELRAAQSSFRLGLAVVLASVLALSHLAPGAVPVVMVGMLGVSAAHGGFQYYYSRRM